MTVSGEATLGLIVVAAGSSRRMGGIDKVWAALGPYPVVQHSLHALAPLATHTVLVVRSDQLRLAQEQLQHVVPRLNIVAGGPERQQSVRAGLHALPATDLVAIHDAARPLATAQLLREGIEALGPFAGAIPVEPVRDTIKHVDEDGRVLGTTDRTVLRAVQTPQVFRRDLLLAAHEAAHARGLLTTDDAALLEAIGCAVGTFPGLPQNFKVTTPFDLHLARLLLEQGFAG